MPHRGKQEQAICWWCNRPGASNEDVIPRWLAQLYPEPAWWIHRDSHPDLGRHSEKKAKGPRVISRKFCEACNTGWMSRLEQRAKPLLTPLIQGEPRRLGHEDQELLSFWISKTVLAFLSKEPPQYRFASPPLYHELYETQAPPAGSQIWLGSRRTNSVAWQRAHSLQGTDRPRSGFGSTLGIGSLVAHFVWHDNAEQLLRLKGPVAAALIQIWPVKRDTRLWPPPSPIEGEDLSWFAKAFVGECELVAA